MHLKLKLGPTAQRAFAVVSWGIALGCAVAVRMHGPLGLREQGSAPALPRAMHLDLAASIVAWTAFHFKVSKTFGRLYGNGLNSRGFAAWTYYTSFVNGLLVQPFLLLHAARAYALSGEPDRSIEGFLRQPWLDGRGEVRACTAPLEQVLCCIMGYVLREYSSLHPDGLQLPYNVHHLICVVGCSHHLVTPGGVGLMALNAVQCETASALYSLRCHRPNLLTSLVYRLSMLGSCALGLRLCATYLEYTELPLTLRLIYAALVAALFLLRFGALLIDLWGGYERLDARQPGVNTESSMEVEGHEDRRKQGAAPTDEPRKEAWPGAGQREVSMDTAMAMAVMAAAIAMALSYGP